MCIWCRVQSYECGCLKIPAKSRENHKLWRIGFLLGVDFFLAVWRNADSRAATHGPSLVMLLPLTEESTQRDIFFIIAKQAGRLFSWISF